MNILETAQYLENLRISLAETARLQRQLQTGTVTLSRDPRHGWEAVFSGKVRFTFGGRDTVMPTGEAIPLPMGPTAPAEAVARDMADRFPDAAIIVRI